MLEVEVKALLKEGHPHSEPGLEINLEAIYLDASIEMKNSRGSVQRSWRLLRI